MIVTRPAALALLLLAAVACSDDNAGPSAATVEPTICATTPAPEGRLVSVTIDDVTDGAGSLYSQADGDLTPGIIRVELIGQADNAQPAGVTILRDGVLVGTIEGVGPGETCGVDLEVSEGVYLVTDGDRDIEINIGP